jgi:YfiH family protein
LILDVITPQWPAPATIRALSTLRTGGVSVGVYESLNLGDHVGDDPAQVQENRRRLRTAQSLPDEPRWLTQVHGTRVVDLDEALSDLSADAAVTRQRGVVCAILTADCLPVLFTDATGECVAAAHAGWRGLAGGVLEATVAAMRVKPSRLLAWLGPAIGPTRFEVGPEVREIFVRNDAAAAAGFSAGTGTRHMANLGVLARLRLMALGLGGIFGGDECTHSQQQRFFSHRRDGRSGRQATLIWKI